MKSSLNFFPLHFPHWITNLNSFYSLLQGWFLENLLSRCGDVFRKQWLLFFIIIFLPFLFFRWQKSWESSLSLVRSSHTFVFRALPRHFLGCICCEYVLITIQLVHSVLISVTLFFGRQWKYHVHSRWTFRNQAGIYRASSSTRFQAFKLLRGLPQLETIHLCFS